ncbi:MAG: hypothetical protein CMQ05_10425 [Gammaproteobacteria bacterium]|nr:hypothetical protein [Gammaproteobacteria bacterium]
MVLTGNPHNGSSAHRNIAVKFKGPAINDLYIKERAVLEMCRRHIPATDLEPRAVENDLRLQVLTEKEIKHAVINTLREATPDDELSMILFYVSDREIIRHLKVAKERGVSIRIILDTNKDAFGIRKSGMPNRPVGYDLHRYGSDVRWADTHGEQCHSKMLLRRSPSGRSTLLLESANYTRRNLDDFNL